MSRDRVLTIVATDLEERELIRRALGSKPNDQVRLRCADCGTKIGKVADTPHGALFTSSWRVEIAETERVKVDGRELLPRERARFDKAHLPVESGPQPDRVEVHGSLAMLAAESSSDLLVRCPEHGDAVLDRLELLKMLRTPKGKRNSRITVSSPGWEYLSPDVSGLGGEPTVTVTRHSPIVGEAMSMDDMRAWLGW